MNPVPRPLPSRRQFVRTGLGLGALLLLGRAAAAPAPGGRTGLLFDPADLPRLRANLARPEFAALRAFLADADLAADARFLAELHHANHNQHLLRAQVILQRCAFNHRLAPDPRQLSLARTALAAILAYPTWDWIRDGRGDQVTVMRGAGTCVALALAADWLADDLTAAEQAAIDEALATRGAPPCVRGLADMTHHDTAAPWSVNPGEEGLPPVDVARWPAILNHTNLRIITTAGLAAAAAHLHGRHPEADRWREAARASLRLYASWQPADGSFGEGIAYWDFTFVHYIFALEVLRRRTGVDDRGLLDFRAQARYALAMTMPTAGHPDDCVNLGDASGAALGAPLAWIAREYRDPVAQYVARRPAAFNPNVLSFWGVAWFDPDVPSPRPTDVPLDTRTELGIVVSRTGWETADNVVVFRCGGPENHEHADRNSVIFKAHGERLFHDPLHAAYATTDPRWLLRQTAAHTAVLVDGRGHIYHDGRDGTNASIAQAQLLDFRTGPQWMATTGDAADAYRRAGLPARMVRRTVVFLKPDVLVLLDRVELDEARPVQARFQVFNEDGAGKTSVAGSAFTISRPGATLRATVTGLAPGHLVAANLPLPAASGVYPYVEYTSDAAAVHEFVTVCTTAPAGGEHGTLAVTRKRDGWSIEGLHRGQMVKLHLGSAAQGVPTVEL